MIRDYWPRLFADDDDQSLGRRRRASTARWSSPSSSRHTPPSRSRWPTRRTKRMKFVYHPSCHMTRLLGLVAEPLHTLERSGYDPDFSRQPPDAVAGLAACSPSSSPSYLSLWPTTSSTA